MFAALFLSSPALFSASENETAAQLQAVLERLNALNDWLTEADKKKNELQQQLQIQDKQIASINKDVQTLADQLQVTQRTLVSLSARQEELSARRLEQAKLIAEHVAAAYRLTGQDFLKQLLNQESPDEFQRMIRYHRIFSESRLEVLESYQATLAELNATRSELDEQDAILRLQQDELVAEQSSLNADRAERATVIAQLDQETQTKEEEFEILEQDRVRLEQLLAQLRRQALELDGSAFVAAKGTLPMPIEGSIRHSFGSRRSDGRLRWHGIDIRADHGEPVRAVFAGRVIFSDWLRGFGLLTIVDHGDDYMTLYGHADVLHKQVGDRVEGGETIAGAGNSGGKKDPGIYFEVRHKGVAKDPITWIAR